MDVQKLKCRPPMTRRHMVWPAGRQAGPKITTTTKIAIIIIILIRIITKRIRKFLRIESYQQKKKFLRNPASFFQEFDKKLRLNPKIGISYTRKRLYSAMALHYCWASPPRASLAFRITLAFRDIAGPLPPAFRRRRTEQSPHPV